MKLCEFFICGLAHPKKFADLRQRNEHNNLRICDLRTQTKKFAYSRKMNYTIVTNTE